MKIATPLLAILLAAFSGAAVRQAKRAWRDPDWDPASAARSPRSPVALIGNDCVHKVQGEMGPDFRRTGSARCSRG